MTVYMTEAEFDSLPRDVRRTNEDGSRVCLGMADGPVVHEVEIVTVRLRAGARSAVLKRFA
jgi:hypothetical protein